MPFLRGPSRSGRPHPRAPGASPGGKDENGRLAGGRKKRRSAGAEAYERALTRGDAGMPLTALAVITSPPRGCRSLTGLGKCSRPALRSQVRLSAGRRAGSPPACAERVHAAQADRGLAGRGGALHSIALVARRTRRPPEAGGEGLESLPYVYVIHRWCVLSERWVGRARQHARASSRAGPTRAKDGSGGAGAWRAAGRSSAQCERTLRTGPSRGTMRSCRWRSWLSSVRLLVSRGGRWLRECTSEPPATQWSTVSRSRTPGVNRCPARARG